MVQRYITRTILYCQHINNNMHDAHKVSECFKQILDKYKRAPDIVVNSAGITKDGFLLRMKEEDFDQVMIGRKYAWCGACLLWLSIACSYLCKSISMKEEDFDQVIDDLEKRCTGFNFDHQAFYCLF